MAVEIFQIPRGGVTYTLYQGIDEAGTYGPAGEWVDYIVPGVNHPVYNVHFLFRPHKTEIVRTPTGGIEKIETIYIEEVLDGNGNPYPTPLLEKAQLKWHVRKRDFPFFMAKLGKAISNSINNGLIEAKLGFSGFPPFNPITGAFEEYSEEETAQPPKFQYYDNPQPEPTEPTE